MWVAELGRTPPTAGRHAGPLQGNANTRETEDAGDSPPALQRRDAMSPLQDREFARRAEEKSRPLTLRSQGKREWLQRLKTLGTKLGRTLPTAGRHAAPLQGNANTGER